MKAAPVWTNLGENLKPGETYINGTIPNQIDEANVEHNSSNGHVPLL